MARGHAIVPWLYNGEEFIPDEDVFGFVYLITNNLTQTKYIGKKFLTSAATKMVDGKKKKIRKPSDWQNYWGSSKYIKADIDQYGKENYSRVVLHLCGGRAETSYFELKQIMARDAILKDEYCNHWLTAQITSNHVGKFKHKAV